MNRIKTLESKSKRTNTPYTTQTSHAPIQANFVDRTGYNQKSAKSNHAQIQKTNDFYENSYLNFAKNCTSTTPTNERKPKSRSTNIDEQQTKYRLNVYQEKLPDHKFFNRSYKPNEITATSRHINDTPSTSNTNLEPSGSVRQNSGEVNKNLTSQSMNMNRLKLLKKRNALKKTLANNNHLPSTSPTTKSHSNFDYNYTLIANSKDEFKSQTSLTNTMTNKGHSNHLSRNSLNNTESYLGSNYQLTMNKSSETIDELHLAELRSKSTNVKNNSLNRVRSTPHINNQISMPAINNRTKSENELINLPEANTNIRFKAVSQINLFNKNKSIKSRPVSRLETKNKNDNEINKAKEREQEAKVSELKIAHDTNQIFDLKLGMDAFEPSPYNIMSDPVISEQFKKLYEEDEYFQQVHKKCCDWLNKHVFPSIEDNTYAISSTSVNNSRTLK